MGPENMAEGDKGRRGHEGVEVGCETKFQWEEELTSTEEGRDCLGDEREETDRRLPKDDPELTATRDGTVTTPGGAPEGSQSSPPGSATLESYQAALEEVLTWLLSAEDGLQGQPPISPQVEEVKEQFHTHEGYMVELTSHQGSVGRVLRAGSALLMEGQLTEEEETEVREQMNLLNSRWEHLRVASMERQSRLHEVLMDLQHQQLKQLTDWLDVTEARIKMMGAQPLGPDLEDIKHQVEEHKVGSRPQSDLTSPQPPLG
ncbi:hypothetical protein NHX12_015155 [Muraenolepis orangiensis]|uniref:Dystrophin n=1 Tax=Muraenolepis orangiensis TaxID=630683 RepID=A0A9Q0DCT9_9TELE|nr:hypothetical protein NHX12_015155 [Muraenolepis orangiensis]